MMASNSVPHSFLDTQVLFVSSHDYPGFLRTLKAKADNTGYDSLSRTSA